ncbi:MAG: trypsin-like peptidase domain-containing protein [Xanthomonadales bacterium]|nr:trypsin-like peptidase domain-containing protein [Xanthomonadales bacterium]
MRFLLLIGMLAIAAAAQAQDWSTEEIFARYKAAVVQVRIIDERGGEKSSLGSGFFISDAGEIVSNYHVVADLVEHPGQFRAEYVLDDGQTGPLTLRTVDVVHDLSLLQAENLRRPFLAIESNLPAKGERLYAFGNPYDLGMTIIEGTYNGLLEKSLYERIHFSGSINPGMSGGPTVDRNGNVIGVNVATAGNQVSFLVPAGYVLGLMEGADDQSESLHERIGAQLFANQQRYLDELTAQPLITARLGNYEIPGKLGKYINCSSRSDQSSDRLVESVSYSCYTDENVYLSDQLSTGAIRIEHALVSTDDLSQLRFWALMENSFSRFYAGFGGSEDNMTSFRCQTEAVDRGDLRLKVVLCLRGYKEYPGLYDLIQRQITLNRPREALTTTLMLTGVSIDHGLRFAEAVLESVKWSP